MKLSINHNDDTGALRLGGALDIYAAEAARSALAALVHDCAAPTLDLGSIEECDAAGVQVLVAARASAVQAGKTLRVAGCAPTVTVCCVRVGLRDLFVAETAAVSP